MVKLNVKLISITGVLFLVFLLCEAWFEFIEIRDFSRQQILEQSRSIRDLMMATRYVYHHQFISSGLPLNDNTLGFLPAHALARISEHFTQLNKKELSFNNVSADPRNIYNRADCIETKVVRYFEENPHQEEYFEKVTTGSRRFYQYATPIWTESYCLRCHGDVNSAPPTISARYTTGFNYHIGDLRGIMSVRIPIEHFNRDVRAQLVSNVPVIMAFLFSLCLLMYWLVQTTIVYRLKGLLRSINFIREGHYDRHVPIDGHDEIADLAKNFERMAQAIELRENRLKQSEQRLENAQRIARIGNWQWHDGRHELFCSDQIYTILECSQDSVLTPRQFIRRVPSSQRQHLFKHLKNSFAAQQFDEFETVITTKSSEPGYVRLRGEFESRHGQLLLSGTLQDITTMKRAKQKIIELNHSLEDKVAQRTAQLQRTNKELEAFSYSVSHDLRAPLRAISGFSQILKEEYSENLSPEARRYLGLVVDNSQMMGTLIDDLLRFSRLNRHKLKKQKIDTEGLVRQVVDELLQESDYTFIHAPEIKIGPLETCYGDPALIKQVFVNLLSNALKFTQKTSYPRIRVTSTRQGDIVTFNITDNGAGFDMQYAEKLFGVFQRLHHQSEFTGTGVGLAIVQRVIGRHQGAIWAQSEPNKGATFSFTLERSIE
ncbi:DUF3365 domain-containing protein [uncultured Desulfuromonas sp.]|uniref:c-type heme family protein n=1 Tax=uncultured Desulfuromonas sp. TaxID=181013 RepID=UPI00374DD8FB